jgi:hypothetical protein
VALAASARRRWCGHGPLPAATLFLRAAYDRPSGQDDVAAERLQFDARAAAAQREIEALAAAARVLALRQLDGEVRHEVPLERAHKDGGIV